jgi:uncharacterized protein involved in exopolysaccharide biosynthesis
VKGEQNELAVEFYENKLGEFRQKLAESQSKILPTLSTQIKGNAAASFSINSIDQQLRDTEKRLVDVKDQLRAIEKFKTEDIVTREGRQVLYDLLRAEVPFSLEMRPMLTSYLEASERYTDKHPEVEKAAAKILDLLDRMRLSLRKELNTIGLQTSNLKNQRIEIVDEMVRLSTREREQKGSEQDYTLYQKLYTEMKVKLEEARMTQVLAQNRDYRFVVLDPAYLPLFPSKPSRILIIVGGLGAGILIGMMLTVASELLDTTIRSPKQIALYQKPIIALLPQGRRQRV